MIECQPVNLSHKICVIDRNIHAFHVLFPVPMASDSIDYRWVQAAPHRVGLPAVPEIMNSGHWVELKAVQSFSPGFIQ
jgi:hypothetical protein